jgi:multiple antibiotic resistance protein
MSYSHFWVDFVTLMTMINPVAVIPLYLSVTEGMSARERVMALRKATLVATGILLAFLIAGEPMLNALGVTLDAFRIAGGLILLLIGLRMVFAEARGPASNPDAAKAPRDIAVFPLAMPFIAGSGAIMSIVLLTENDLHSLPQKAGTAGTMCLVLIIVYVILRAADGIQRLLGSTGINVVSRIMGLVVTALATQVMIIGAQNIFTG